MNKVRCVIPIMILGLFLGGCINLQEVRDFSARSAELSGYTELTDRFRDTYQREEPYLTVYADEKKLTVEGEQKKDEERKEAYGDFIEIHKNVSLYMRTLAKLAGDETFDVSKEIGAVAEKIKEHPEFDIKEKHVDAYSELAKVVAKWLTIAYQQRAVQKMVKEGNGPLQTVLDGMTNLVRVYEKAHDNEEGLVLGLFRLEDELSKTDPQGKLLSVLSRLKKQSKELEYRIAKAKYAKAEEGIKKVAEGHKKLAEDADKLSSKEVRAVIGQLAKDIQTIVEALRSSAK